eukprot:4714388-Karenia_brevis.AAC.1
MVSIRGGQKEERACPSKNPQKRKMKRKDFKRTVLTEIKEEPASSSTYVPNLRPPGMGRGSGVPEMQQQRMYPEPRDSVKEML